MLPEWIWSALSGTAGGAFGVIVTLKVAMARMETSVHYIATEVATLKLKMEHQVGDARCDRMRMECQTRLEKSCGEIKGQLKEITDEMKAIGKWMAKHNGG